MSLVEQFEDLHLEDLYNFVAIDVYPEKYEVIQILGEEAFQEAFIKRLLSSI